MQQSNTNTEKIRSILASMERSIDNARRKRLNKSEMMQTDSSDERIKVSDSSAENSTEEHSRQSYAPSYNPSASSTHHAPAERDNSDLNVSGKGDNVSGDSDNPPRLKARPKRPSAFFQPMGESEWQSRAS